jgi:hypothetical protein
MRNIKQKPRECEHEIVDIGIYDLLKQEGEHTRKRLRDWERLETTGWKVVPDCPDILGEFGVNSNIDNVEYSFELLEKYYNPENKHHLPVIQSKFADFNSFQKSVKRFTNDFGIPNKIAIGSICKLKKVNLIVEMIEEIFFNMPNTWIHVFGMNLNALMRVKYRINSFDSTSWGFSREPNMGMARNKDEKRIYFINYLNRIDKILNK